MSSNFLEIYDDYSNRLLESIKDHQRIINQLETFILQRKDVQSAIFNDLFTYYLKTQRLLEDIIDDDINVETITEYNKSVDKMVRKEQEDFYSDGNNTTNK